MLDLLDYSTKPKKRKGRLTDKYTGHNTQIGDYGEKHIKRLLHDSGYFAKEQRSKRFCGDLWTVNTLTECTAKIEVKTALQSSNGQFQFCIRKDGHTDNCYSDYVILLCIDKYDSHYIYCIPSYVLDNKCLKITSHPLIYAGKYAPYRVHGLINLEQSIEVAQLW